MRGERIAMGEGGLPTVGGRPLTPADWARIASGERWRCHRYLAIINVALMEMIAARMDGVSMHLMILAPPQHGKTTLVGHALPDTWFGYFPDDRIILASYEARTAEERGETARDDLDEIGPQSFGYGVDPKANSKSDWRVDGHSGTMISRGVGGPITGAPCDLFLTDDPIGNDKDVQSKQFRDDQYRWYMRVVINRMMNHTCSAFIYTPWHHDDLGQRLIRASLAGDIPPMKILRFPAVSETQEERDSWARTLGLPEGLPPPDDREPGVALWEAAHSLESHLRMKKADPMGFAAMRQSRPTPEGGNKFRREWVKDKLVRVSDVPAGCQFVRAWDKAASTKKKSDYTSSTLMARSPDGRYFLFSNTRDKLSPSFRDRKILEFARNDLGRWGSVCIYGEIDPGQAGLGDDEATRKLLEAFWVETAPPRGDKEYRFMPFCSAAQGGNVFVVCDDPIDTQGTLRPPDWFDDWCDELESFPKGLHDDRVDSTSGAYNRLAGRGDASWVGPSPLDGHEGDMAPRLRIRVA